MENQREHREHGKKDVAEKTSKEITVNSLAELFADDEFGFEMFIMTKTGNPPIKHFTFYEGPTGRENDFKHKVQMYLQKELKMGITILNVIIVGTLPYAQSKKGKKVL